MEYLDAYDRDENLINEKVEREYAHYKGLWHKEILVIVLNYKNEILLQQRSYNKKFCPGKWALLGGHVITGHDETNTAIRELREEINLNITKEDLIFIKKYKRGDKYNKKIQYIYVVRTNNKIEDFSINKNEIRELKYESLNNIKERISSKDYSLVFSSSPIFHLTLFDEILKKLNY